MATPGSLSHVDAHWDHADAGQHHDITKGSAQRLHVDVGHVDVGHLDVGHVDFGPVVLDVDDAIGDTAGARKLHIDLGHADLGHLDVGHLDFGHLDVFHFDVHVDITRAPEPQGPDALEAFARRVDQLITRTAAMPGLEAERQQLAAQLRELREQVIALRDTGQAP
jgi:hypothetical protein